MILISIILIFAVHHIIHFFKSTLTVPKIKDLVHSPLQKYEHMIQHLSKSNLVDPLSNANTNSSSSKPDQAAMKEELKMFLKNKIKKDNTTDIASLDSYGTKIQEMGSLY